MRNCVVLLSGNTADSNCGNMFNDAVTWTNKCILLQKNINLNIKFDISYANSAFTENKG